MDVTSMVVVGMCLVGLVIAAAYERAAGSKVDMEVNKVKADNGEK